MSPEGKAAQPTTQLVLIARPGIAIRLVDGALTEIAKGTERLELEVPPGLYMAQWEWAGQRSETMVRVGSSETPLEVRFDPSDTSTDAPREAGLSDKIALVDAVSKAARPSSGGRDSSIVLIVSGEEDALEQVGDLQLRLYDRNEVKMRADREATLQFGLQSSEQSRCYGVRPGRYHIGFNSILGDHLGQSVPALAGRQTLVFLKVLKAEILVSDGTKLVRKDSVGIDPAQTIIVTIRGDEEDYRVRERVRLATIMMFDLTNRTHSLTPDVVDVLNDPLTDPLLRLYGALVALCATEGARSEPSDEAAPLSALPVGPEVLESWIGDPVRAGLPTDAICATWAAARLLNQAGARTRIETPPMFECSWRWAVAESIANPDAMRGAAVVAAARSHGGTTPWLCWKIAASKARFVPAPPSTQDVGTLLRQIAEQVQQLTGTAFRPDMALQPETLLQGLEALAPEIQAAALQAVRLASREISEKSGDLVEELAVSLGLPSRLLQKRLANTHLALQETSTKSVGASKLSLTMSTEDLEPPPAMARPIQASDDPQKGRFGGRSRRAGFELTAEFKETTSKNWVQVVLTVTGQARDGSEAVFYLHDSFRPSINRQTFKKGIATLSLTIWGGFTVGVWIPDSKVELELDLAKNKKAPAIVVER